MSGSKAQAGEQDTACPQQAPISLICKLLGYDRTLAETQSFPVKLGILYRQDVAKSRAELAAFDTAAQSTGDHLGHALLFTSIPISWTAQAELGQNLQAHGVRVVYVTAGLEEYLPEITAESRALDILTLAGSEDFVAAGVSLGMDGSQDPPRFQVNLQALKAEGHQFDARLLRLCQVVVP